MQKKRVLISRNSKQEGRKYQMSSLLSKARARFPLSVSQASIGSQVPKNENHKKNFPSALLVKLSVQLPGESRARQQVWIIFLFSSENVVVVEVVVDKLVISRWQVQESFFFSLAQSAQQNVQQKHASHTGQSSQVGNAVGSETKLDPVYFG